MLRPHSVMFVLCLPCAVAFVQPSLHRFAGSPRATRLAPPVLLAEEDSQLATLMKELDADGDGEVTQAEFRQAFMKATGETSEEVFEAVWTQLDADGDGTLSPEELENYFKDTSRPPPPVGVLGSSVLVGGLTGLTVAGFKESIALIAKICDGGDVVLRDVLPEGGGILVPALWPVAAGVVVTLLKSTSSQSGIGPTLAEHVAEVERSVPQRAVATAKRGFASVVTLGTGCSLGPEAPSVELGVGLSRLVDGFLPKPAREAGLDMGGVAQLENMLDDGISSPRRRRQRQLIASGAAAGVAAGLNAPLAGVFFALEVIPGALRAAVGTAGSSGSPAEERRKSAELDLKSGEAISSALTSALVSSLVVQVSATEISSC